MQYQGNVGGLSRLKGFADEGDVSLAGPVILMMSVLAAMGLIFWLNKQGKDSPEVSSAVERVKDLADDIENDDDSDLEED